MMVNRVLVATPRQRIPLVGLPWPPHVVTQRPSYHSRFLLLAAQVTCTMALRNNNNNSLHR